MNGDDYADEEWVEDQGDPEDVLLHCPACGRAVHEDTQQCPHCGDWITPVDRGGSWKRTVWLCAVALLIVSLLLITVF